MYVADITDIAELEVLLTEAMAERKRLFDLGFDTEDADWDIEDVAGRITELRAG